MSIIDDVLAFIRNPEAEKLEPLAVRVFRYQFEKVPAYRAFVEAQGLQVEDVTRIEQIPAVSTQAFKYARLENDDASANSGAKIFLTSGTTIGRDERGRHVVPWPAVYQVGAIRHMRRMLFPDGQRLATLALHPTADRLPESSLSQMISWSIDEFGNEITCCAATREGIDLDTAINFLSSRAARGELVCIFATTAACARLFGEMASRDRPIALPHGSRLMDTGGAKGQGEPLSSSEVVELANRWLGLDPAKVINEYGMTELCSQLYDATIFNSDHREPPSARVKLAPPWLIPFALDPATLRPVAPGQVGMLTFFDLANVGSVSMLMTEDLGIVRDNIARVIGRAQAADARGCALAIAEFAQISNG